MNNGFLLFEKVSLFLSFMTEGKTTMDICHFLTTQQLKSILCLQNFRFYESLWRQNSPPTIETENSRSSLPQFFHWHMNSKPGLSFIWPDMETEARKARCHSTLWWRPLPNGGGGNASSHLVLSSYDLGFAITQATFSLGLQTWLQFWKLSVSFREFLLCLHQSALVSVALN